MFLVLGGKKVGFQLTDLTRTNARGRNANMITEPGETNDEHMERFSLVRGYCIKNTFFFSQVYQFLKPTFGDFKRSFLG